MPGTELCTRGAEINEYNTILALMEFTEFTV